MGAAARDATPRLVRPALEHHASFLAALSEYQAEERNLELDAGRLAAANEFAQYVAALCVDADDPGAAEGYVLARGHYLVYAPPRFGYVPQTILWWVAGDRYLGRLAVRHRLTPDLLRVGGHIGYEVRPSARGRGHATAMLAAALPLAAALGIDPVHIDCDVDNVASRRVIERNGGRFERREGGSLFYLIPTGNGA